MVVLGTKIRVQLLQVWGVWKRCSGVEETVVHGIK